MKYELPDDNLVPWIGKTAKMMEYFITNYLQEEGYNITKEQWILMFHLSQQEEIQQNNLACVSNRNKTSLTRIVTTLEKKGYVKRVPDKLDKRSKLISLTEDGITLLRNTKYIFEGIKERLSIGISVEESKQMIEILKKVQQNIDPSSCD